MSKELVIAARAAGPQVDTEPMFELRDRFKVRPHGAVHDLGERREVDAHQLARLTQRPFANSQLHIPGEEPGNFTGGFYRRHVGPVGDALAGVRTVRAGHRTSVDDRPEARA